MHRRRRGGRRAAVHGTGVHRNRNSCVGVKRDDWRRGRAEGRVRDQESKLSIGSRHQLEAAKDLRRNGFGGTEFGAHGGAADGQSGRKLHVQGLGQVRLLGRGLLGVVDGQHLVHAAGQVVEEPRPHLRVHALGGGEEAGDLVHALVESGSVFAQNGGVS